MAAKVYKGIKGKGEESSVDLLPRHVVGTEFCFFLLVEGNRKRQFILSAIHQRSTSSRITTSYISPRLPTSDPYPSLEKEPKRVSTSTPSWGSSIN